MFLTYNTFGDNGQFWHDFMIGSVAFFYLFVFFIVVGMFYLLWRKK